MKELLGKEADLVKGKEVITGLVELGITKLNFVGGEPLLHPHLKDLAALAKDNGLTTSIVTNGSLLSQAKLLDLRPHLDWIGISIDSSLEGVEATIGRGRGRHVENTLRACNEVNKAGVKLKVNTVVTKLNFDEDMRPLIAELRPLRWKVFQMLIIAGQKDGFMAGLAPTNEEFAIFKRINSDIALGSGEPPTFETSDDMVDSYLMLGPDVSVIQNSNHQYKFIPLETIVRTGLSGIVSPKAYFSRGGKYDW